MDMAWTEQLSAGNDAVDSEHKILISLVNDVKRMIETRDSSALSGAFEKLETWLDIRYKNEENKAQAANIDFSNRKLEQQFELNGLFFLRGKLVAKNGAWSAGEAKIDIQFLSDWLIEHITSEDMHVACYQAAHRSGKGMLPGKHGMTVRCNSGFSE